jgi:hypothetical protein
MRALILAVIVVGLAQLCATSVQASTINPPPSIPPWCDAVCQAGPPPPPTPVPKLSPPTPAPPPVSVRFAPLHVHRGHTAKVVVSARGNLGALVVAVVRYAAGKPVTYKGKVDGSGTYAKAWKVPAVAPLGKASVRIEVEGAGEPTIVSFVVTK